MGSNVKLEKRENILAYFREQARSREARRIRTKKILLKSKPIVRKTMKTSHSRSSVGGVKNSSFTGKIYRAKKAKLKKGL